MRPPVKTGMDICAPTVQLVLKSAHVGTPPAGYATRPYDDTTLTFGIRCDLAILSCDSCTRTFSSAWRTGARSAVEVSPSARSAPAKRATGTGAASSSGVVSCSGCSAGRSSSSLSRVTVRSRSARRWITAGRWLSRDTCARSSSNSG